MRWLQCERARKRLDPASAIYVGQSVPVPLFGHSVARGSTKLHFAGAKYGWNFEADSSWSNAWLGLRLSTLFNQAAINEIAWGGSWSRRYLAF